jgi:hypothetical protein
MPIEPSTTTTKMPARAIQFNAKCTGCLANTSGPCRHETLPICFAFGEGTTECEERTFKCEETADSRQLGNNPKTQATVASHKDIEFVIVTGADESHSCPLMNQLKSLRQVAPDVPIVVYDLGTGANHLNVSETCVPINAVV